MLPALQFFPTKLLLEKLYVGIGRPAIRLATESGEEAGPTSMKPKASIVFCDKDALLRVCMNPEVGFNQAYAEGRLRVEGDLATLIESVYNTMPNAGHRSLIRRLASRWLEWRQRNTLEGSRRNIHHHYDLPTEFFQLWLDPLLVYTCAYFPSLEATLEEAQLAKMTHVCRKLRLTPGERVVEAGCGWGALALHMAQNYGVKVRAYNISHEQIVFARGQAKERNLEGFVEFVEDDYRNISGEFDVFVSVGMLEHVGPEHYPQLGNVIHQSIGDVGRGLLHFIGRNCPQPMSEWFRKFIFPGAYLPTLVEALQILEPHGFCTFDVENIGPHYAKTLEHWLNRFEAALPEVRSMFDEQFVRTWRLYLAEAMVGFRVGHLQLFQIAFAGARSKHVPWTRADLYAEAAVAEPEQQWTHATR
jgi:cyclopropane-fatty-acyl-phospholipid synthase